MTKTSGTKRINFTLGRVSGFTCPPDKSQAFMWDSDAPGLGLRVTKAGTASYIFQCRIHDKAARVTIGSRDAWDIAAARKEARRLAVLVDNGTDPRQDREDKAEAHAAKQEAKAAKLREATRQAVTFGEVWPRYIEDRAPHWGEHSIKDHAKAMQAPGMPRARSKELTRPGALYALKDVRMVDLTHDKLAVWLKAETAARPTTAARAYRLLRAFLNWASEQTDLEGLAKPEAVKAGKVRQHVASMKPKKEALEREQLAAWFSEVRKIQNPIIATYLQALLLTGARPESMRALRWQDVDFKWNRIKIRDKAESYGGQDGTRTIPLTPYLASLLHELKRRTASVRNIHNPTPGSPSPWVFASATSASGHITEPGDHAKHVCHLAGITPHITLHDLRRSFSNLSEWVECPTGIASQIMGHKPSATAEKHYKARPIDLLRKWHTKIEGWILEQAGIEQPAAIEAAPTVRVMK